jgi:hypothetical protein
VTEAWRTQKIFPAALIASGGRNSGNPDFPVAEVKRNMLIRRPERLALVAGLIDQFGSHILHFAPVPFFPCDALLSRASGTGVRMGVPN